MENPLTHTYATDGRPVRGRAHASLLFYSTELGVLRLDVDVNEPGVLYTHVGAHESVPPGAAIVLTQGSHETLPVGVIYRSVLHADRGEMYADTYYDGAIPDLRVFRNDARWALDAVHDSDDLTDPELVRRRVRRLDRLIERNTGSTGERKRRAVSDATRAKFERDKRGQRNPMAAAMANWGAAVQLDKQLRIALNADERVSRSRVAIVRLLASIWKCLHDCDVELASMTRWWKPGRKRPLQLAQAKRLAERAARTSDELTLITAAPYAQMPLLAQLRDELDAFVVALNDRERFRAALPLLMAARRSVGKLLIHRQIAQMLVTAGMVRRFKRPIKAKERREYAAAADRACNEVALAQLAEPSRSGFLDDLLRALADAKQIGLEDAFDARAAYDALADASDLYLDGSSVN
ncbi:hypothetical protein A2348_05355 [Candidatus Uhrbacteria bacterium RIFOXYB12_FULL_58_10]|uniref:Uncharacterized protein n=1 Tax=Candidatus Uhrbacteria bacterium RIFOXYB2_FULL_57_15 TaxID=1802422 RepID=A0A1F7W7Y2_9BACT|nr:MAG: hypothetical protein A2348_05355 [Candidatus Uhrbacteria bacterium RIFOXYB12_FULL_58_10]OGL98913.1 MAG: hypothetical protein A2304_04140 [Candidatus Uhrbacteria bacterium RIFOXYB2_FULL_57_15]OGM00050.1 MAG: hypothetical protein A2501_03820 [Candidatus Uhrbacteria bacterium RIFOXYC12_FULL_57_11]